MIYVLATSNPGKVREMHDILLENGIMSIPRHDMGMTSDIDETGSSFFENAMLKARAVCDALAMPAIADDSGLEVEALGGEPGVFSSSYGGEDLSDLDRCAFLLKKMEKMEHRNAKFVCITICAYPDGSTASARGECFGKIALAPSGTNGFGYDPVFIADETGCSVADLLPERKNALSHRGIAIRALAQKILSKG